MMLQQSLSLLADAYSAMDADLWKRLKAVSEKHQIEWVWSPKEVASAGYEGEDAIELAQKAMEEHSR